MNNCVKVFCSKNAFSCNVYVLHNANSTILIDPGYYDAEIGAYLNQCGGLDAVLLTHGHWDHIRGLDLLLEDFPNAKIFHHMENADFLTDPNLNCSASHGFSLVCKSQAIGLLEGTYTIAGTLIAVLHTPGHSSGSCIYLFPDEKLVFSGDTFLLDQASPTFRPTGSAAALRCSVREFIALGLPEDTFVYCGHFGNGTYADVLKMNPDFRHENKE